MVATIVERWRSRLILIGVLLAIVIALFFATFKEMALIWWTSSTFNHCLLIIPISIWLVFDKRELLRQIEPGCSRLGIAYASFNAIIWLIGGILSIAAIQHAAAVGVIIGSIYTLIGRDVFRVVWFPLIYLYFAVPEGEFLVPALQDWTAAVTVTMLRLTNIPVYLEGRYLTIPTGQFHVAEACSGINYLIATLAVGSVFAYLRFESFYRRLIFMLLAIAVPLVANGIRAYGIVMIAHLSDYKYALGIDHYIYGGVFFGLVILLLFSFGSLFSDVSTDAGKTQTMSRKPAIAARKPLGYAAILLLFITVPSLVDRWPSAPLGAAELKFVEVANWVAAGEEGAYLGGLFAGRTDHLATTYRGPAGETVRLEISFYRNESPDGELINQNNRWFDDETWVRTEESIITTTIGPVRQLQLRDGRDDRVLAWNWYDISGRVASSNWRALWYRAQAKFSSVRLGVASVSISTPLGNKPEAAAQALRAFAQSARLDLPSLINNTGSP